MTKLFAAFFESEKSGGIVLIGCTIISLGLANSGIGHAYLHLWHIEIFSKSTEFWINDGLMTIFFLLVGLEIEREVYIGELSDIKKAMLPTFAALGGMIVPAAIHFLFNYGTPTQSGIGIPMATDIAFSLGILSLLGNRVPISLKIFLTALAIIDDLGAIAVIAIFYSHGFSILYFGLASILFALMLLLNRLKFYRIWVYLIIGMGMWFCMYRSGIHATITGVLLAFAIPFGNGDEKSPSYDLQRFLHVPVAFIILPLFALANTGIVIPSTWSSDLLTHNSLGIVVGLMAGKPLGIFLFSLMGISLGICTLPDDLKKHNLLSVGLIAGIGFTMSIFITLLAFNDSSIIDSSKIAVLVGSFISAVLGFMALRLTLKA